MSPSVLAFRRRSARPDEDHRDVARVVLATNIVTSALAIAGTLFYLLGWPTFDTQVGSANRGNEDEDSAGAEGD
jgi:hypothetical protein